MKRTLFLLLTGGALYAQTLDEVIDYALKHSTAVAQSAAQKEMALWKKREKRAEKYGAFDAVGSFTHYNLPRTLAPMTPSGIKSGSPITVTKDLYSAGLAYSVPLFTGFAQTKSVEIEHLAVEMADAKMKLTKEQLVYNIRMLYLTLLALEKQQAAQQAYADALLSLRKQIAFAVKVGKKAKLDLLKAEAAYKGAQTQVDVIAAHREITRATLAALSGMDVEKPEPVQIAISQGQHYSVDMFGERLASLTKMKMEDLSLQKAQKMVEKSKAVRYPQVVLSAYLGKNYGTDEITDKSDDETLWQAGLNLKYDLFDFGKSSSRIEQAKIAKLQAKLHRTQTLRDLKKELAEAIAKIKENRSFYFGNKAALKLSRESEKIENIRYQNGAATLNDLLLAKSKTLQTEAKVIDSLYSYQKSIYYFDYILETGVDHEIN